MSSERVLIFANGVVPQLDAARQLMLDGDYVVCADGGLRHAEALGLMPDVMIGDLDSLDADDVARLERARVQVVRHQRDKDQTDLELAIDHALGRDPSSIVIVGALGARIDHTLGNIGLLSDARLIGRECRLDDGVEELFFCRDRVELHGRPGDTVSIVPWGLPAEGVRTDGLRWALRGENLAPESTRGISNEMLAETARVMVAAGSVLIIHRRVDPFGAAE